MELPVRSAVACNASGLSAKKPSTVLKISSEQIHGNSTPVRLVLRCYALRIAILHVCARMYRKLRMSVPFPRLVQRVSSESHLQHNQRKLTGSLQNTGWI